MYVHSYSQKDKKEKSRDAMKALLSQQAYRSVMCNVVSILNPKLRWATVQCIVHVHVLMYFHIL